MSIDLLTDGSFEHLLCTLSWIYQKELVAPLYLQKSYQQNLFSEPRMLPKDMNRFEKFSDFLVCHFGSEAYEMLYHLYLYGKPFSPSLMASWLLCLKKHGPSYLNNHADPIMHQALRMSRKVTFEVHRFLGILRFKQYKGYLISQISPDHRILTLLAQHFADRLKHERFMIIDERHQEALHYQEGCLHFRQLAQIPHLKITDDVAALWQVYFEHIAISERKNKALQQNFIPLRYRKHMTEFNPILPSTPQKSPKETW